MHDEHACACGHEHAHGHAHEDGCTCGHEHGRDGHTHDHEAGCTCAECAGGIRLTHTAGATAATVRFSVPGPRGPAEVALAEQIKALAAEIGQRGGLVGHIKAALTGAPEVTTFSCTGGACTVGRRTEAERYSVDLVAIVLAMDDAALQAALTQRFLQ